MTKRQGEILGWLPWWVIALMAAGEVAWIWFVAFAVRRLFR